MPYAKLFRSRWAALLWAGSILWFAVEVAGVSPREAPGNNVQGADDATGVSVDGNDLAILAAAMKAD